MKESNSYDHQRELIRRHQGGDSSAIRELILVHDKMIRGCASRFATEEDDLYQEGCLGVLDAANLYFMDSEKHPRSFIRPNIIGRMKQYMINYSSVVRTPAHLYWGETRAKVDLLDADWDAVGDQLPQDEELAIRMADAAIRPLLDRMAASIPPNEAKLVNLRYIDDLSLLEAGKQLVSGTNSKPFCPEGIRKWEKRIFKSLRKSFVKKALSYDEWLISSLVRP